MASKQDQLHIFFLPFLSPSHMIPALDMARIFTTHGIQSTIVTTPANVAFFIETIDIHNQKNSPKIDLVTMKFPSLEVGLPEGYENGDTLLSTDLFPKFLNAIDFFQQPLEELIANYHPNCLVADYFFHWASKSAKKFGIPCLVFHGSCYFSHCIMANLRNHEPHKKLSSDSEVFVVPGDLPHEIKLTNSELSPSITKQGPKFMSVLMEKCLLSIKTCYGVIMNSFYELEPDYADYYEKIVGKHWYIGPFMLHFSEEEHRSNARGKKSSIDASECIRWLDEKEPNSVIYVCFGSSFNVPEDQLHELTLALEDFDQNFILVVKNGILDGFEERVKEKGLIIRGWAPQTLILNHRSTGAFVTHCGWNSILEGVTAGLPMMTWPQFAEQFYNEKLITDVLKIGVQVGAKVYPGMGKEVPIIHKEQILRTMKRVISGEEAQDMRKKVKELGDKAKMAVLEGGSSSCDLKALIEELKSLKR